MGAALSQVVVAMAVPQLAVGMRAPQAVVQGGAGVARQVELLYVETHFNVSCKHVWQFLCISGKRRTSGVNKCVAEFMTGFDKQIAESDGRFLEFEGRRMKLEAEMEGRRRVSEKDF